MDTDSFINKYRPAEQDKYHDPPSWRGVYIYLSAGVAKKIIFVDFPPKADQPRAGNII
jgi:hypothetical protein